MSLFYDVRNLQHKEYSNHRHDSDRDDERDDAFGHRKLVFGQLLVAVFVVELIALEDFAQDAVVGLGLEEDIHKVGG